MVLPFVEKSKGVEVVINIVNPFKGRAVAQIEVFGKTLHNIVGIPLNVCHGLTVIQDGGELSQVKIGNLLNLLPLATKRRIIGERIGSL